MYEPVPVIWKFNLRLEKVEQRYKWPFIVRVLGIQMQYGSPVMWALVRPETAPRLYKIVRLATGDPVIGATTYLGTVQVDDEVYHYFSGGPGL